MAPLSSIKVYFLVVCAIFLIVARSTASTKNTTNSNNTELLKVSEEAPSKRCLYKAIRPVITYQEVCVPSPEPSRSPIPGIPWNPGFPDISTFPSIPPIPGIPPIPQIPDISQVSEVPIFPGKPVLPTIPVPPPNPGIGTNPSTSPTSPCGEKPTESGSTCVVANPADIQIILFPRDRPSIVINWGSREQLIQSGIHNKLSTKIIIHGYLGSTQDPEFTSIRDAYNAEGYYNIIGIDWSALSSNSYMQAITGAQIVGTSLGEFINLLIGLGFNSKSIHIIGHGIGAHIAGIASTKVLQEIGRITGLDPYIIEYTTQARNLYKLNPEHAIMVDVIHTNIINEYLALQHGKVDFYLNGGKLSPSCSRNAVGNVQNKCVHGDAYIYFALTITHAQLFKTTKCSTVEEAVIEQCKCPSEVYMGQVATYLPGIYYIKI